MNWPEWFLERLKKVRGKRARIVVDHILQHGFITTEQLKSDYGYDHPPRAIRDVRDQGIPLETFYVKNESGQRIAAYRFGDLEATRSFSGRQALPKQLKQTLYEAQEGRCVLCGEVFEPTFMQVDHRIPYSLAGEGDNQDTDAFMLVCKSCNRSKGWACQHCENVETEQKPNLCQDCFWASPADYRHIASVRFGASKSSGQKTTYITMMS